jgi:hypothetical protein
VLNKSNHGNINHGDSNIPFMIGGAPILSMTIAEAASIVDVAPTIAGLLGFSLGDVDGRDILLGQSWSKTFGGSYSDFAYGVQETHD